MVSTVLLLADGTAMIVVFISRQFNGGRIKNIDFEHMPLGFRAFALLSKKDGVDIWIFYNGLSS
jgi:hypothetical protein